MTKVHQGGCLCCPQTEDVLSMDEVLYYGFGGYTVKKDGEVFYKGDSDGNFNTFKRLKDIEEDAALEPDAKWEVVLFNPLRGATWERRPNGRWILTETNIGFA